MHADADKLWLQTTDLNNNNYKFVLVHRSNGRGGGIGIIYKSQLQMEPKCNGQICYFEYGVWKVKAQKTIIMVITIYHPPYTAKSQSTNAMFLNDFTNWLSERLPDYKNVVITGDFNIHINNQDNDDDALTFLDTITATGLQIHNRFPMHRQGNTLDPIMSESISELEVINYHPGHFMSDHCLVQCELCAPQEDMVRKTINYQKPKNLNTVELVDDKELDKLDFNEKDLDNLVIEYENKIRKALDKHTPEIECSIVIRYKFPWFTNEIHQQKRIVGR